MIPHITIEQYSAAFQIKDTEPEYVKSFVLNTYNERIDKANKAIEIALAEQQESEYITAEEARKLGAGNAEYSFDNTVWYVCKNDCEYSPLGRKYRAIKQAQPETVIKHFGTIHEENGKLMFTDFSVDGCGTADDSQIAIAKAVIKRIEGGLKQAQPESVEQWEENDNSRGFDKLAEKQSPELLIPVGPHATLRAKTIKLDGKMVTPEQAAAEWEAKKETCDLLGKSQWTDFKSTVPPFVVNADIGEEYVLNIEYELRPKALKQIKWGDIPVGVAVIAVDSDGENACVGQIRYAASAYCVIERASNMAGCNAVSYDIELLKLAHASEQPWIAVQRSEDGIAIREKAVTAGLQIELHHTREKYRITGIAKGYVLEGAV